MPELSPRFNFKDIENKWCRHWEENNIFHAKANPDKSAYAIVIPPPNVTGILHMGHALNNTLQDIVIRTKRMQGFETCWMPGTDHAGIATQNVVEKQLAKEGKTRYDVGREKLLLRLWAWKKEYGDTIINQLKRLGSSCDWQRTRFTMDDPYSEAVKDAFIRLYEKGLIYRGKYIINWCPRCQTALSDEEVEHREQQGALYHIKYSLQGSTTQHIVVATTRPETMLGDTAVAVNPDDKRYKDLIGKTLILPLLNREIVVVADDFVDPEFGTGAVKVTPAHDPNDFEIGNRHKLDFINVMHPDGRMNEQAGEEFAGMDRFEAREAIIEALKKHKLLDKVTPHTHTVGHCYRCHTVVEPYLSQQWFVKMKPLAAPALQAVKDGKIKFHPDRWTKVYLNWMENIRDWCISRQIWWGHRIPVWYCVGEGACKLECREPIVSRTTPGKCPHCGCTNLRQDEDVLDTWFSSWLWPFATFDSSEDRNYFYPTASLFTASEIIFFWVARMIMAGFEFMGDIPFRDVYIHGTVRDSKGLKMSKSLGNAIDPLEIIEEYGADALRFSLIINSGQDLYVSKEKFEIGRNFANKIWNASRLILMNVKPRPGWGACLPDRQGILSESTPLSRGDASRRICDADLPSRWIVSKFHSTLAGVNRAVEGYRFSEAENLIYEFFWKTFCDWYLEIIKNKFADENIQKTAFSILEQSIRMMHPFMPFVTEEIWARLEISDKCLAVQPWPQVKESLLDPDAERDMQTLIDITGAIRNIRVQWNIKPNRETACFFSTTQEKDSALLQHNSDMLKSLARINEISIAEQSVNSKNAAVGVVNTIKFCVPLGDIIDIDEEKKRILAQIGQKKKTHDNIAKRLKNKNFLNKAPRDVVEGERNRLRALEVNVRDLRHVINTLE